MNYWAVAQFESRYLARNDERLETPAELNLARNGIASYLPQIRVRRDGETKIEPLFPGYIFAHVVDGRWHGIRWAIGALRVLMAGDHPARLLESDVMRIRGSEVAGFVKLPKAPAVGGLVVGQEVKILSGSFTGHIGLYAGQSAHERELVLLNMLGRQVRVELSAADRIVSLARPSGVG